MNITSYYGLTKNIFQKNLKTEELYESETYKEGIGRLEYIRQIKGIGLITGVTGIGKTTLIRGYVESLNKEKYNIIYISLTNSSKFEFLTILCRELGVNLGDCYLSNIKRRIQKEIIRQKKEYEKETLIFIDNAERLNKEILKDMDFLYEFQYDNEDYTSIVLSGEEEIREELKKSIYEKLSQRMVFMYHLEGLKKEETKDYIRTRLEISGQKEMIFTENAINVLHNASRGVIRKLNTLINLSLMIGYQEKKEKIDEEMVRIAVEESKI